MTPVGTNLHERGQERGQDFLRCNIFYLELPAECSTLYLLPSRQKFAIHSGSLLRTRNTMYYVLIVDDSDVDRLLMEGLLKKVPGFEVIGARDGVHALEQLKAWSIDMVITDIQMPRMDGLELIKAARKDYPDIPVVLTTGMGSEEIAAVALKSGAASYIPKSRLNKMLISTVEETFDMLSSCLLYTSPSPRDLSTSRMPSSA